ncbi:isochorismatase family protein [Thermodesulfobacteriota bacterium]
MTSNAFKRTININDSILLIVDIQERLMPVISRRELVEENAVKLIKFAKSVGLQIIYTEQEKLGDTLAALKEELSELTPISKTEFGCFSNDTFKERFKDVDKKTLIIAGVETHICVTQTVLSALDSYDVHVVSDAVSSRTLENHRVGLDRMQRAGAVITSVEMVIFELLKKAGTDEFKTALKLIK